MGIEITVGSRPIPVSHLCQIQSKHKLARLEVRKVLRGEDDDWNPVWLESSKKLTSSLPHVFLGPLMVRLWGYSSGGSTTNKDFLEYITNQPSNQEIFIKFPLCARHLSRNSPCTLESLRKLKNYKCPGPMPELCSQFISHRSRKP